MWFKKEKRSHQIACELCFPYLRVLWLTYEQSDSLDTFVSLTHNFILSYRRLETLKTGWKLWTLIVKASMLQSTIFIRCECMNPNLQKHYMYNNQRHLEYFLILFFFLLTYELESCCKELSRWKDFFFFLVLLLMLYWLDGYIRTQE